MKKLLKFLLSTKFKTQKLSKKDGFTLIELLVGLIMAAFIITPLLGFVINVMSSDRQEQAKSSSEQEIQTALDYISRDVSQAIFIYDGLGVKTLVGNNALPKPAGESTPVLVFWKREIKPEVLPNKDDAFVFSLVAYYLIKDTTCGASTWSCTARISRVQMDDSVKAPDGSIPPGGKAKPEGFTTPFVTATTTTSGAPAQTPEQRMNSWTTTADFSNVQVQTLIDYVDQTTLTSASPPPVTACSQEARGTGRPDITTANPTQADLAIPYPYRQTPNDSSTVPTSLKTGSFYACVDTDKNLAQVFIRGNSLARISSKNNPPEYSANKTTYFPRASIQVKGSSLTSTTSNN
jgi:type II secretory pathway pseudopilin PulG